MHSLMEKKRQELERVCLRWVHRMDLFGIRGPARRPHPHPKFRTERKI